MHQAKSLSGPDPVDVHVGSRIKLRRTTLGLTQDDVAAALGFSHQQLQKYEKGLNRVSASRLFDFSLILNVEVAFFFDGMGMDMRESRPVAPSHEMQKLFEDKRKTDPFADPESLELLASFRKLQHASSRDLVLGMVKQLRVGEDDKRTGTDG